MTWDDIRTLARDGSPAEAVDAANAFAREHGHAVTFGYRDGMWVRSADDMETPAPDLFDGPALWDVWQAQRQKYLRDADDYWFHVYRPREGDVIVDIGAGRGEDAYAFSRAAGAAGTVWAFEPHPVTFGALRRLCEWNGLTNVRCSQVACTEVAEDLQIETLPLWESNYVRSGPASETSFAVQCRPFDEIAGEAGIGRIDFLKMNIEGAERMALPGCRRALERARYACISAHDFRADRGEGEAFRTLAFVRAFLENAGFRILTRDDPRYYVPYHVHAWRD
ncbi:MAG TPA: hypothetical protein DEH78_03050 [Solibacterales bacterium]|nr:hypothetical protein [Bryobacterales bacterium]